LPLSAWRTIPWREGTKGTSASSRPSRSGSIGPPVLPGTRPVTVESKRDRRAGCWRSVSPQRQTCKTLPRTQSLASCQRRRAYWFSTLSTETSLERLITLAHARWVIEQFYARRQTGMWLGSLPGTQLDGLAPAPGSRPAGLQFSHAPTSHLSSAFGKGFFPPAACELAAWRPSAGVALALPGSHPLAALHPAVRFLLSQTKLTE
jgi:hypothetical protein